MDHEVSLALRRRPGWLGWTGPAGLAILALAALRGSGQTVLRPAEASEAAVIYRQSCQQCHGADGRGSEARGAGMPYIPNFTRAPWHRKRHDKDLLTSILDGKGSQMPAFDGKLSRQEAGHLVSYVRTFSPEARKPTQPGPTDFERRFRELEDQMKELRRQFRSAWPADRAGASRSPRSTGGA